MALLPAIRALRVDITSITGRGGLPVRISPTAYTLVAIQVTLATMLTLGGAVLYRTVDHLRHADLGFTRDRLIVVDLNPRNAGVSSDQQPAVLESILHRTRDLSNVQDASVAVGRLMRGVGLKTTVAAAGVRTEPNDFLNASTNGVQSNYLETTGLQLITGRAFTSADEARAKPRPAIVTRSFALRFFGREDAIGRYFGTGLNRVVQPDFRVIGVVSDTKYRTVREQTPPIFFTALNREDLAFAEGLALHVRVRGDEAAVIAAIRDILAHSGPGIVATSIATINQEVDRSLWRETLLASLSGIFATLATVLAGLGLYAALAQSIGRRRREFGIRIALGAAARDILLNIARDLAPCLIPGLAAGALVYLAAARLLKPLLYDVEIADAPSLVSGLAIVLFAALLGALLPAIAALRIRPAQALRDE